MSAFERLEYMRSIGRGEEYVVTRTVWLQIGEGAAEDTWMAAAPELLPIVPRSRLWLPKLGIGDDERFASIFRNTWHKIPLGARRLKVKHWRENSAHFPIQGLWSPTIQLTDYWELSDRTVRQPKDLGVCGRNGHSLYFYAPAVDAVPAQHVEELIAHELRMCGSMPKAKLSRRTEASRDGSMTSRSLPTRSWNSGASILKQ